MSDRLEKLCISKGLRMTGQRRVIARVISQADDHPDVEKVYDRATEIDPAISSSVFLTTVTDVIGFFTFLGLAAWVIL